MKTFKLLLLAILIGLAFCANSQPTLPIDTLVKNNLLNYSVPDIPAFNGLGIEPMNLLKPSSPRDYSFVANQFLDGSRIIIPKTLAIEVAPMALMQYNSLTLEDYQKKPIWYDTRVSFGTYRDSTNLSRVALGLRTTLLNKGDIRSDTHVANQVKFLKGINQARIEFYESEMVRLGISEADLAEDTVLQKKFEKTFAEVKSKTLDSLEKQIDLYRQHVLWNQKKWDVALCIVAQSPDSSISKIAYNSFFFWTTYATPIKQNGQLMVGLNFNAGKSDSVDYVNLSIPARFYIGTNAFKGFFEGQYFFKGGNASQTHNCVFSLGSEFNLYEGLWLDYSAGLTKDFTSNNSGFTYNFKFIYAIPEKKE